MSIISGRIQTVNSTKILVLPSINKKRQLTVYSNTVATPEQNALCIPVPNPQSVRFERVPKDIFKQCENSFGYSRSNVSKLFADNNTSTQQLLPVQSQGPYNFVILPSLLEFYRIPPSFTVLSSDVKEFMNASYPENYGMIICKLKPGYNVYEPIAYSHDIQPNGQIFIPTKHYHKHASNISSQKAFQHQALEQDADDEPSWATAFGGGSILGGFALPGKQAPKFVNTRSADDWDHEIYTAETPVWCHESKSKEMLSRNRINWGQLPADFQLGEFAVIRCKEMKGHNANTDIEMPIQKA